jgi:hypothetical protein
MSEWGITPEYILDNWTEAELLLMFQKRNERIQAANEAMRMSDEPEPRRVSAEELFSQFGGSVKKVH